MDRTLFVGDLPSTSTERDLETFFSKFGKVLAVNIIYRKENYPGQQQTYQSYRGTRNNFSLGYGFVEMEDSDSASAALELTNQQWFQGRFLRVNWAQSDVHESFHRLNDDIINSCHIRFKAAQGQEVTESSLHAIFSQFGQVIDVSIKDRVTAKNFTRGYGFVHFGRSLEGRAAAYAAANFIGIGLDIDGVWYRCELSKNLLKQFKGDASDPMMAAFADHSKCSRSVGFPMPVSRETQSSHCINPSTHKKVGSKMSSTFPSARFLSSRLMPRNAVPKMASTRHPSRYPWVDQTCQESQTSALVRTGPVETPPERFHRHRAEQELQAMYAQVSIAAAAVAAAGAAYDKAHSSFSDSDRGWASQSQEGDHSYQSEETEAWIYDDEDEEIDETISDRCDLTEFSAAFSSLSTTLTSEPPFDCGDSDRNEDPNDGDFEDKESYEPHRRSAGRNFIAPRGHSEEFKHSDDLSEQSYDATVMPSMEGASELRSAAAGTFQSSAQEYPAGGRVVMVPQAAPNGMIYFMPYWMMDTSPMMMNPANIDSCVGYATDPAVAAECEYYDGSSAVMSAGAPSHDQSPHHLQCASYAQTPYPANVYQQGPPFPQPMYRPPAYAPPNWQAAEVHGIQQQMLYHHPVPGFSHG